ncbi:hypothetical protein CRG98_011386 [Punica granatum]|uniref:Uncharacterized protein n=1 Tax=Punica granatum TaxID=22663 RepID=A0A2I0KI38_PUNGR|nr:hypothetical protein CRG98_011386 [Punica granatum]
MIHFHRATLVRNYTFRVKIVRRPKIELRTPATSVEGSGSLIGGPDPESTGDFDSGSSVDSGSGPPIGDLDPSTRSPASFVGANTLGGGFGVAD